MPGQALKLGPYSGGLNLYSDVSLVQDNELIKCVNFELDLDFALTSRPPIQQLSNAIIGTNPKTIGSAVLTSSYVFASSSAGTFFYNGDGTEWLPIDSTFVASACVQYGSTVYFLCEPGGSGVGVTLATWVEGPLITGTFTYLNPANLNTMLPGFGGGALAIYKERLYIVPGKSATANRSRVVYSDVGNPSGWSTTTQFFDVGLSNDGQNLVDILVYTDNLLLFKEHSTYVFSYTSTISNAELIAINTHIGASANRCVVPWENSVFIFYQSKIYEMNGNYDFQRVNTKVPFEFDNTTPDITFGARTRAIFLCVVGDRLVARYFNKIYVMGLKTRAWTEWKSTQDGLHNFGPLVRFPPNPALRPLDIYHGGTSLTNDNTTYFVQDGYGSGSESGIICTLTTKNYDFNYPHLYKRLFWWGVDVVAYDTITTTVTPVVPRALPTWNDLSTYTWDALSIFPWNDLISPFGSSSTTTIATNTNSRVFIKRLQGLRFRQVRFTVTLTTDGSFSKLTKLFFLTAFVKSKETAPATLS